MTGGLRALAALLCGAGLGVLAAGCRGKAPARPQAAATKVITAGGVEMVLVPGGWFEMGSDRTDQVDEKRHRVYVDAFHIDACEVTQEQYERVTGTNPSRHRGPDQPVEQVRWFDAIGYCNARSRLEGLTPCYDPCTGECSFDADGYRLPTEAEWERAARAGTTTTWYFGDDPARLDEHAWYKGNDTTGPRPVAGKAPNPWGLHDVCGNVWEWCHDWYGQGSYGVGPRRDPRGPAQGEMRVLRGGCWNSKPDECRSAYRFSEKPAFTDVCFGKAVSGFVGIRCVRRAGRP